MLSSCNEVWLTFDPCYIKGSQYFRVDRFVFDGEERQSVSIHETSDDYPRGDLTVNTHRSPSTISHLIRLHGGVTVYIDGQETELFGITLKSMGCSGQKLFKVVAICGSRRSRRFNLKIPGGCSVVCGLNRLLSQRDLKLVLSLPYVPSVTVDHQVEKGFPI